MGDYITFGAFFFLPQHNGKTQSCPEAKASSAAKNHTPRRRKIHYLSVFIGFYDYWMLRHFAYQCAGKGLHDALKDQEKRCRAWKRRWSSINEAIK